MAGRLRRVVPLEPSQDGPLRTLVWQAVWQPARPPPSLSRGLFLLFFSFFLRPKWTALAPRSSKSQQLLLLSCCPPSRSGPPWASRGMADGQGRGRAVVGNSFVVLLLLLPETVRFESHLPSHGRPQFRMRSCVHCPPSKGLVVAWMPGWHGLKITCPTLAPTELLHVHIR